MKIEKSLLLVGILLFACIAQAKLVLPNFFSDNMVLQQDTTVAIWGWDNPGQKIKIETTWGASVATIVDDNGYWKGKITTPLYDQKKHEITILGSDHINIVNVVFGEVWFASGQSNMTMKMKGSFGQPIWGGNHDILYSKNENIRMWTSQLTHSLKPEENIEGSWQEANPSTVPNFSAVGYYFAKELEAVLDVPVGIILSGWGGSRVEAWMDSLTLYQFENYAYEELKGDKPTWTPMVLYNAMINPFLGYSINGFIWYQGEANRSNPDEYVELFPAMIESWREKWNNDALPCYYVQIAPFNYGDVNSAYQREAQMKCANKMSNSGMVVTIDVGECDLIHPGRKDVVGQRLAYWALSNDYGFSTIACKAPEYDRMEVGEEGRIVLRFKDCRNGLSTFGKELTGFQIAGSDQQFFEANATLKKNNATITVWSEDVKNPVAVRYLFDNCVNGHLYSQEGIPVSSFRTDDW